ncbi:MAG TPA: hypothetical protein VIL97_06580, partial [Thermoanaerobaculia bacterium]
AEVVIGDRDVARSPHMGPLKRFLQRFGSRAVGIASGMSVPDVTSGFRAFSREAAYQINVFNPFTYTLETVIQAGNRNLGLKSVIVETNAPTRPSRLYRGIGSYVRKSIVTVFRIYTIYKPLKTFFFFGMLLFLAGVALGGRFLYFYLTERSAGHVQSLILAAVFLILGFQTILIGLLADLISVNRRLNEEILIRLKRSEPNVRQKRPRDRDVRRPEREQSPAQTREPETQWVWLVDESKLEGEKPQEPATVEAPRRRRRRRRHPGIRHFSEPIDHRHHADEE